MRLHLSDFVVETLHVLQLLLTCLITVYTSVVLHLNRYLYILGTIITYGHMVQSLDHYCLLFIASFTVIIDPNNSRRKL